MAIERSAGERARRHGHRILQAGAVLFLLGTLIGLAVPNLKLPRLGLSTHLLGVSLGTFLLAIGQTWPRLKLSPWQSTLGSLLAVYGSISAWTANLLGAFWGAGGAMFPFAASGASGAQAFQDGTIRVLVVFGALALIGVGIALVWGLRGRVESEIPTGVLTTTASISQP